MLNEHRLSKSIPGAPPRSPCRVPLLEPPAGLARKPHPRAGFAPERCLSNFTASPRLAIGSQICFGRTEKLPSLRGFCSVRQTHIDPSRVGSLASAVGDENGGYGGPGRGLRCYLLASPDTWKTHYLFPQGLTVTLAKGP